MNRLANSTVVALEGIWTVELRWSGRVFARSCIALFILLRRPCSASLCEAFLVFGSMSSSSTVVGAVIGAEGCSTDWDKEADVATDGGKTEAEVEAEAGAEETEDDLEADIRGVDFGVIFTLLAAEEVRRLGGAWLRLCEGMDVGTLPLEGKMTGEAVNDGGPEVSNLKFIKEAGVTGGCEDIVAVATLILEPLEPMVLIDEEEEEALKTGFLPDTAVE
ncbi:hypothetical protein WICPIJ_009309 [Wickerhamomyces pijperi]|uniref:Uncharacterized protein n=1 Tax=Wickerhamomyces pijperi TaxID=599730 RepID=A0A9P8PP81_WICPI|nr:hypothetical protein WICPIJ_009309 [Wickerhamomyces pijperi]